MEVIINKQCQVELLYYGLLLAPFRLKRGGELHFLGAGYAPFTQPKLQAIQVTRPARSDQLP